MADRFLIALMSTTAIGTTMVKFVPGEVWKTLPWSTRKDGSMLYMAPAR